MSPPCGLDGEMEGEGGDREAMEGREALEGEKVMRLFGVTICGGVTAAEGAEGGSGDGAAALEKDAMRKSKSMGNLSSATAENGAGERGYLSDGGLRKCRRRRRRAGGHDRKKGIPWTEEEHRTFLEGLEKLGKGDWRGIARKFVLTRTPTQVASHAQKYFIRQTTPSNKKRRSSLFDVVFNDVSTPDSNEMILLHQGSKKEETPELYAGPTSSIGPERRSPVHFMENRMDVCRPRCSNRMEEASDSMDDKPAALEPVAAQNLSLMLSARESMVPSKSPLNGTSCPMELQQPLPCCPSQANKPRFKHEGNDLELSIAPPKSQSLNEVLTHNGVGVIRVV